MGPTFGPLVYASTKVYLRNYLIVKNSYSALIFRRCLGLLLSVVIAIPQSGFSYLISPKSITPKAFLEINDQALIPLLANFPRERNLGVTPTVRVYEFAKKALGKLSPYAIGLFPGSQVLAQAPAAAIDSLAQGNTLSQTATIAWIFAAFFSLPLFYMALFPFRYWLGHRERERFEHVEDSMGYFADHLFDLYTEIINARLGGGAFEPQRQFPKRYVEGKKAFRELGIELAMQYDVDYAIDYLRYFVGTQVHLHRDNGTLPMSTGEELGELYGTIAVAELFPDPVAMTKELKRVQAELQSQHGRQYWRDRLVREDRRLLNTTLLFGAGFFVYLKFIFTRTTDVEFGVWVDSWPLWVQDTVSFILDQTMPTEAYVAIAVLIAVIYGTINYKIQQFRRRQKARAYVSNIPFPPRPDGFIPLLKDPWGLEAVARWLFIFPGRIEKRASDFRTILEVFRDRGITPVTLVHALADHREIPRLHHIFQHTLKVTTRRSELPVVFTRSSFLGPMVLGPRVVVAGDPLGALSDRLKADFPSEVKESLSLDLGGASNEASTGQNVPFDLIGTLKGLEDSSANTLIFTFQLSDLGTDALAEVLKEAKRVMAREGQIIVIENTYPSGAGDQDMFAWVGQSSQTGANHALFWNYFQRLPENLRVDFMHFIDWLSHVVIRRTPGAWKPKRFQTFEKWKEAFANSGFAVENATLLGAMSIGSLNPLPRALFRLHHPGVTLRERMIDKPEDPDRRLITVPEVDTYTRTFDTPGFGNLTRPIPQAPPKPEKPSRKALQRARILLRAA